MTALPIVDVDSHVTEPPDLWTSRLSPKWGDEVPQVYYDDRLGLDRWRAVVLVAAGHVLGEGGRRQRRQDRRNCHGSHADSPSTGPWRQF